MNREPAVLDTDALSELSRGNPHVSERAPAYLADFGRLTITVVTVFARLRGYRVAIRDGKPFERQMQAFDVLVPNCIVGKGFQTPRAPHPAFGHPLPAARGEGQRSPKFPFAPRQRGEGARRADEGRYPQLKTVA